MAITKLISPNTPNPIGAGVGGDWEKAMAQLTAVKKMLSGEQMILTQWTNNTTAPALAKGSYFQHMGAIYVVDTEDYALPALSADGTYYIKLTISGETLVPSYITSLTGFSWSAQHNGLYNASDEQVLPYSVIREGSAYGKRKILNLASSPNLLARVDYQGNLYGNAISGASLGVTGNATVSGTLGVTGNATVGGDATVGGTLGVANISTSHRVSVGGNMYIKGWQFFMIPLASILTSFASPNSTPTGLAFDGTNLISCDSNTDRIYVHNGISASILTSFASPSSAPMGLVFDGTNLISCDSNTDMIYVHNGISASILTSFASPSSDIRGLAFDGTNLISCDSIAGRIYVHNGISASILTSFASPNSNPTGLAFDGTNLISSDLNADRIYVHNGVSTSIVISFASPSSAPRGLAFDGTNLMSCDSTASMIYVHDRQGTFL